MATHNNDSNNKENIPIINISSFANEASHDDGSRERTAKEWDCAMTNVGFAIIEGHGVSPEVITSLRRGAADFFSQATDVKLTYNHGAYGTSEGGYTPIGVEAVNRGRDQLGSDGGVNPSTVRTAPADLVESYVFRASPNGSENHPPSFSSAALTYHNELERVLNVLHKMSAAALGLPSDFFEPYCSPGPVCHLRLAWYPPLPSNADDTAMRYGEHTDYTGFTILSQDEADVGAVDAGGLQVLLSSGVWHAVTPRPNAFVVNIGDLYQIWTNGRWRSTVHRVANPPIGSAAACSPRLSIPFFTGPQGDAVIEAMPTCVDEEHPVLYAPIKTKDHLARKLAISNAY